MDQPALWFRWSISVIAVVVSLTYLTQIGRFPLLLIGAGWPSVAMLAMDSGIRSGKKEAWETPPRGISNILGLAAILGLIFLPEIVAVSSRHFLVAVSLLAAKIPIMSVVGLILRRTYGAYRRPEK